jgi:hypothetical protein
MLEIILSAVGIAGFITGTVYWKIHSKNSKKISGQMNTKVENINFQTAKEALRFLDDQIQKKFEFYTYSQLLPLYHKNTIPEEKVIREIKDKIYIDIVGSFNLELKKEYQKFFTKQGVEIYINQTILILLNKLDFQLSEKEPFNDISKNLKTIDEILK